MIKQRIIGLLLIFLSIAVILMASTGTTTEEKDITAVLFILPLGLYTLFTKEYILNIPLELNHSSEQKKATSEAGTSADGRTK